MLGGCGKFATTSLFRVEVSSRIAYWLRETMTVEEVLQRLIREGALIADALNNGMLTLPICAELVTPAPGQDPPATGWLYWVEAGAEDQHHTHFRPYTKAEVIHGRDLRLMDANSGSVAYIAPIEEWDELDVHELHSELAHARQNIARTRESREVFDRFVANCRPTPAPAG